MSDDMRAYGCRGLIGVLTPQANTIVEPECWCLLPAGWSLLNARLTSSCETIEARLLDYTVRYHDTAMQFANAPLNAIAIACTGTSYLIERDEELQLIKELQQSFDTPCITAAQATHDALRAIGAERLALLTPYPQSLQKKAIQFWQSKGYTIVASKTPPIPREDAFHPIYAMSPEAVYQSYQQLSESDADVVLMLGTGMATLAALLRGYEVGLKPALSCNLALMCRVVENVAGAALGTAVRKWQSANHWRARYNDLCGVSNDGR